MRFPQSEFFLRKTVKGLTISFVLLFSLSVCGEDRDEKPLALTVIELKQHGLAMLLETPEGLHYVIDAGGRGDRDTVARCFTEHHVDKIEGLVISHPHGDHQGGVPAIFDRWPVKELIVSPFVRNVPEKLKTSETEFSLGLQKLAEQKGTRVREVWQGSRLEWGADVRVEVLWPPETPFLTPNPQPHGTYNNNSLVLRVQYKNAVFLFPGDIGNEAAAVLVKEFPAKLKAHVVVVPHHGFFGNVDFARAVQAPVAIASCIVDYPDHPTRNVPGIHAVDLFAPMGTGVYVTPWHGTVTVSTDGNRLSVEARKNLELVTLSN
ncbi:ComEC/Rec2 family competence protein [Thermogutta sp.]|uniref:ComEC/Rec2 family competence protein n=1 Tax=Thermogutta sp. TaxID=1962930 RepID=UPI003C7D1D29